MNLASLKSSNVLMKTHGREPFYANRMPSVHARALPFKGTFEYNQASFWVGSIFLSMATRWPSVTSGITIGQQTMVSFGMNDPDDFVLNGRELRTPAITIGSTNSEYWISEGAPWISAIAIFPDNMAARGWPQPKQFHLAVEVSSAELAALRRLLSELFYLASTAPEVFSVEPAVHGMVESIYAAYDDALTNYDLRQFVNFDANYSKLMRKVDGIIGEDIKSPIYSERIAEELNVTIRTLHNVSKKMTGLSLHRYIYIKRMWAVRQVLLKKNRNSKIKSIAFDHGFWHLGRFSVEYRKMFGETPLETLAG